MKYYISFLLLLGFFASKGQNQAYVVCQDSSLFLIDVETCSKQLIGKTSIALFDIAFNPISKEYYAIDQLGYLQLIDVNTGNLTNIGHTRIGMNALTFSHDGILYAMQAGSDNLYSINTSNGFVNWLGSTGTGIYSAGDLTFYNGKLYLSGFPNFLVEINTDRPAGSQIVGNFHSLSFVFGITTVGCRSQVYAFASNDVYKLELINLLQSDLQCNDIVPQLINGATAITESVDLGSANIGSDTVLCNNEVLNLDATSPNSDYLWQDSSTTPTYTITSAGTYWVKVKQGNCTMSDTIVVDQHTINFKLGEDTTLCYGDTLLLNPQLTNANYTWQDSSNNSFFKVSQAGIYHVKASKSICSDTDTIAVYFNSLQVNLGNDTALCKGDTIIVTDTNQNATYLWHNNSTDNNFVITQAGTYWLTATREACSVSDTLLVGNNRINADLGVDTTLCKGSSLLLNATEINANYLWQNGSIESTFLVNRKGIYIVRIEQGNCVKLDSILIEYDSLIVDLGNDTSWCGGESKLLNVSNTMASYLWQNGSTDSVFVVKKSGVYTVEVSNLCGTKLDTLTIEQLDCECTLYTPNAFSPNGDGLNDTFYPKYDCEIREYALQVFNKWGELIFETRDPQVAWNGTYLGRIVAEGAYVYRLSYASDRGESKTESGKIVVVY